MLCCCLPGILLTAFLKAAFITFSTWGQTLVEAKTAKTSISIWEQPFCEQIQQILPRGQGGHGPRFGLDPSTPSPSSVSWTVGHHET